MFFSSFISPVWFGAYCHLHACFLAGWIIPACHYDLLVGRVANNAFSLTIIPPSFSTTNDCLRQPLSTAQSSPVLPSPLLEARALLIGCLLVLLLFSLRVVSDSFVTPWSVAHQAPLSMGFPRQEYWSGLSFPSLGDLPNPGIEPVSPTLADRFFTTEPPGKSTF